ncbi:ATP-binding cassette domain-containing protein [Paenibacillus tritici]|uniref:ATP-binding cassette domain-containing protein n=1 Tax=Paenibacillus tritici TaxID=1873425 RepID=UPI001BA5E347|nr:ATP-binding cassette domain-containing protein [Paenibacillus tritici]QUL54698.1 ATP-binding cassette domain-containing protein [Paenibacillus tritici]
MRIQAKQFSFRYEDGRQAIQDISLDIPSGTLTVLCGVNGSGKSTLLRLLAGLAQPTSGRILHGDGKKGDHRAAEAVSMVFQQPETQLFAGTVHKDIEYGLTQRGVPQAERTEIIASALRKTGLAYDEFAGRSPFLLSGGEKRRVCIAGALAAQPGLLILDEPTAGLDPQAAQSLLGLVQELRRSGLTLIIGTHDLDSFLPLADKVIVMKQGAVHYDGPAPALTADPALLADAGLTPPAYASIGRRAVQLGLLEGVPGSLEELLAELEKHQLPVPEVASLPAGSCAPARAISPDGQSGLPREDSANYSDDSIRSQAVHASAVATSTAVSSAVPPSAVATSTAVSSAVAASAVATSTVVPSAVPPSAVAASTAVPSAAPPSAEAETAHAATTPGATQPGPPARRSGWQQLDPRVKWLGMILGSLVLLGMDALLPLLLTAGLLAGLAASARISWRRALRFFRPFLLMFLFLWLLSGLSWSSPDFTIGPLSFSYAGMLRGGISVLRFLLLIALGFLFTETTTGAPLREGLEWGIAPLRRLGIRTRNWSLAVSVTLQFVPWILGKLAQLQLALGSRGRRARGLARWSPRQIALLIVPLLILVLGMGDELATAVESRGYDPAKQRTPVYQLRWSKRDTLAALGILAVAALLWWTARIS